jgi:hypothetical protein
MRAGAVRVVLAVGAVTVASACSSASPPVSTGSTTGSVGAGSVAGPAGTVLASEPGHYIGSVTLRSDKAVVAASAQVVDLALANGGIVYTQDVTSTGGARAVVVIKVPHNKLQPAFDGLARLGQLTDQRLASDDPSAAAGTLDERVANAQAAVARLRDLIGRAGTAQELAGYEQDLTAKQHEVEALVAEKQMLATRPDLEPITVTVLPRSRGFGSSLGAGARAALIVALGMLGIALVVAAVFGVLRARNTRHRRLHRPVPSPFDLGPDPEADGATADIARVDDGDLAADALFDPEWPPPAVAASAPIEATSGR